MKKKKPLARTLRFIREYGATAFYEDRPQFSIGHQTRTLKGPVGARLNKLSLSGEGKAVFLDKEPGSTSGHFMVVGTPYGLTATYFVGSYGDNPSEHVQMCSQVRDRIVGGVGKVRWAKLKVA